MPKKKKAEVKDPHEGRPSNSLTFGDFIVKKVPSKNIESKELAASCSSNNTQELDVALSVAVDDPLSLEKKLEPTPAKLYFICRTKKGGIPVKVENRSSGKKVTVIEHILGDGKLLVQDLKNKFGTGGIMRDDYLELQGDFKTKLTKYLNENKHLLKPYGSKI